MEVWGGIECTINRLGDRYIDQLELAGHYQRAGDLSQIAALGVEKIRYPILWEKHQSDAGQQIDWKETAVKLDELKVKGIGIIAGLVHHGSGPPHVSILDSSFEKGLANYAGMVAKRFPWITHYTPINEPLTTARFCGLYGLWHPHQKSDAAFLRILINECRATIAAMKTIRQINPEAKLVQTEDLGYVHSTPKLVYQAEFENLRRWLSIDLLTGLVTSNHPLWHYLTDNGIPSEELEMIASSPCPPDIFGINYYITSQRYLDEKTEVYPQANHGGNGRHQYADIEAIRSRDITTLSAKEIFHSAWDRYHIAIALTEVHLHCGREDQLRWILYIYQSLKSLEENQIPVVAITFWSLLGSFGWEKLLTGDFDRYESGAFDIRSGRLRKTAVAVMIENICSGKTYHHPVLQFPGWWEKPSCSIYGELRKAQPEPQKEKCSYVLILQGNNQWGDIFAKCCQKRDLDYFITTESTSDNIPLMPDECKAWALVDTRNNKDDPKFFESLLQGQLPGIRLKDIAANEIKVGAPDTRVMVFSFQNHRNGRNEHQIRSMNFISRGTIPDSFWISPETAEFNEDLPGFADFCIDLLIDGEYFTIQEEFSETCRY